jgi:hypothetical protein
MTRAIVLAFALLFPMSAAAGESAGTATPLQADAATCTDAEALAKQQTEREAKLAELGRRLAAEAQTADGDLRVLNRSGHNYDVRATAAGAPAAGSDTKSR